MRKFAKFLSMVLVIATLATLTTFTASAHPFTDVSNKNEYLNEAVDMLNSLGIAKGTSDTTFGTKDKVTREQMSAFIYRLMKAGKSMEGGENITSFTDLKDPTFYYMISWASQNGIIKGRSETKFDPRGKIILQDAYVMLVRALGYEKDKTLDYPYEFIDVAESLGLGEGLEKVGYEDNLTRGNVAIILYNALYAEMNETYKKNVTIPPEKATEGAALQVYTELVPETVWHKIYNVEQIVRRVVATPNYAIDLSKVGRGTEYAAYKPTGEEAPDEQLIQTAAVCVGEDSTRLPKEESLLDFKELGLSGKADDYFLSDLTMYVNPEGVVMACVANGTKGENKAISFETHTGTNKYRIYQDGNDKTKYRLRTGKVNFDTAAAYFYNKPYGTHTYAVSICPTYRDEEGRLTFTAGVIWNGNNMPSFTLEPVAEQKKKDEIASGVKDETGHDALIAYNDEQTANHKALTRVFSTANNGGRHFSEYYDTNSDGIIEYVNIMPMTWGQVVSKSGKTNTTVAKHVGDSKYRAVYNSKSQMPEIYITDETHVEGGSYEDGKFVYAYVSGPANMVKVASDDVNNTIRSFTSEVVKLVVQTNNDTNNSSTYANGVSLSAWGSGNNIVGHVNSNATGLVALSSDETASEAFKDGFASSLKLGATLKIYHSGSRILWAKKLSASDTIDIAKDYAVVKYADESDDKVVFQAGGIELDGSLKPENYVQAFIGEGFEMVKLKKNATLTNGTKVTQDNDYFIAGKESDTQLVNNLCIYSVDSKGYYTFEKLVTNPSIANLKDEDDDTLTYSVSITDPIGLDKFREGLYQFVPGASSGATSVPAALAPNGMKYLALDEEFKMVVNYIDEEGYSEYEIYDYSKQPDFDPTAVEFTKTVAVIRNNTGGTATEYLKFLYCEIGGEIIVDSDLDADYGIVIASTKKADEDGAITTYYTIVDPKTGEIKENVETHTKATADLSKFVLYELTDEGKIKNSGGLKGDLNAGGSALHTIKEFDADSGLLVLNGVTDPVLVDEKAIVAVFDRETSEVRIEDSSILNITYAEDASLEYHTDGITDKTIAVITESRSGEEFRYATLIIVARG